MEDGHRHGRLAVEIAVDVVVFGPEFDAFFEFRAVFAVGRVADEVPEKHVLPLLAAFDDDIAELLFVDQPPLGVDRELKGQLAPAGTEAGRAARRRLACSAL